MEIIRRYATPEEAINVKNIIQDLLVTELDKIMDLQLKDDSLTEGNSLDSECAWALLHIKTEQHLTKNLLSN